MAYLSYRGSILDQIRDDIKLDSIYRKQGLDNYDEESYDDFANDYDYDYTFDYADWLLTMGRTFRKGNKNPNGSLSELRQNASLQDLEYDEGFREYKISGTKRWNRNESTFRDYDDYEY